MSAVAAQALPGGLDVYQVVVGLLLLAGSSAGAIGLRRRLDRSEGPTEPIGLVLALMVANILQLMAVIVVLSELLG